MKNILNLIVRVFCIIFACIVFTSGLGLFWFILSIAVALAAIYLLLGDLKKMCTKPLAIAKAKKALAELLVEVEDFDDDLDKTELKARIVATKAARPADVATIDAQYADMKTEAGALEKQLNRAISRKLVPDEAYLREKRNALTNLRNSLSAYVATLVTLP